MKHGQCAILVVQKFGNVVDVASREFISVCKLVSRCVVYICIPIYQILKNYIYTYIYVFFNVCVEQIELEGETVFFLHNKFQHHGWSWYSKKYLHV